jgi:hypothetical protein
MYTINLVIGDWSHDGHGKSDHFTIESNLTTKEMNQAYKSGSIILGFDFVKTVARDYEDNMLRGEAYDTMVEHGILEGISFDDHNEEEGYASLWTEDYAEIYLRIVALGSDSFGYKKINGANLNIGGYGLYY